MAVTQLVTVDELNNVPDDDDDSFVAANSLSDQAVSQEKEGPKVGFFRRLLTSIKG